MMTVETMEMNLMGAFARFAVRISIVLPLVIPNLALAQPKTLKIENSVIHNFGDAQNEQNQLLRDNMTTNSSDPSYRLVKSVAAPVPFIIIFEVRCKKPTFGSDQDQVYLKFGNKYRYPEKSSDAHSMKALSTWNPPVYGYQGMVISLMERDTVGGDDVIGEFRPTNTKPGFYTELMRGDGAFYEVDYFVAKIPASAFQ